MPHQEGWTSTRRTYCRRGQQPTFISALLGFYDHLAQLCLHQYKRKPSQEQYDEQGMLWQGYKRAGRVTWFLAKSPGGEVSGQVDTSFPASEFEEWLLGKLDRNPSEPSYTPGLLPFILKLLSLIKILSLLSFPPICARLCGWEWSSVRWER